MKLLILASQHGNEYSGEKLYAYIKNNHPELLPHITYILANPQARKRRQRFIETDMNRSYTGRHDSYEERRANAILKLVSNESFDLVLDMHTTTVDQAPCLIIKSVSSQNERFVRAASITNIVAMNDPIVDTSINGACPQAVSVELYENVLDEAFESLCGDIQRYLDGVEADVAKYVYEIAGLIAKTEVTTTEARGLRNFELSDHGYYPVLMGEKAYERQTDYLGFKAYRRYKLKV